MSKELHFEMRAKEMAEIYTKPVTKKQAVEVGKSMVKTAIDNGEITPYELMAKICRLKEFINAADSEARTHLPNETYTAYGVTFTPVNGGDTLNYKEDQVWLELKARLTEREELLKIARKSKDSIYDSEGIEVPKVGTTPRKSSITIKF